MNEKYEEDIYSEDIIEEFVEDDMISGPEEGFMRGYLAALQG
ncbi:MAG TPA: hypothetical protein VJC16_02710 [Candidatus Nanoarchaeia archaeon]|nr:hypothetical protein [Candidatus Nanoarchaeia archaeon]